MADIERRDRLVQKSTSGRSRWRGRSRCVALPPENFMRIARCKIRFSPRSSSRSRARVQESGPAASQAMRPERFRHNIADHHPGDERCKRSWNTIPMLRLSRAQRPPRSALTSTPPAYRPRRRFQQAQDRAGCRALTTSALADQPHRLALPPSDRCHLPQWNRLPHRPQPFPPRNLKITSPVHAFQQSILLAPIEYVTRHRDSSVVVWPGSGVVGSGPGVGQSSGNPAGAAVEKGQPKEVARSGGWPGMLARRRLRSAFDLRQEASTPGYRDASRLQHLFHGSPSTICPATSPGRGRRLGHHAQIVSDEQDACARLRCISPSGSAPAPAPSRPARSSVRRR